MTETIINYFPISLMITFFIIGYMSNDILEGIRTASYAGLISTLMGFTLYIMINKDLFTLFSKNPVTNKLEFHQIPPEAYSLIYSFCIPFIISLLIILIGEGYVKIKQGRSTT